jgi:hypothetical protein
MEFSPSRESASCSATKKFSNFLRNKIFNYHIHNSPTLLHILGQINPINIIPSNSCKTSLNTNLPSSLVASFLLALWPKSYMYPHLTQWVLHDLPIPFSQFNVLIMLVRNTNYNFIMEFFMEWSFFCLGYVYCPNEARRQKCLRAEARALRGNRAAPKNRNRPSKNAAGVGSQELGLQFHDPSQVVGRKAFILPKPAPAVVSHLTPYAMTFL